MQKRGLSQEGLKLIACITMLLDHIGVVIVMNCVENATGANKSALLDLYEMLRMVGRLTFPIYCFLLVEGSFYTRNSKRYGMRLLIVALLSEIPYDLVLYGEINWQRQNVMVTLLLGFLMLETMKKYPEIPKKALVILPFLMLADLVDADYEIKGILTIALFALTRDLPRKGMWQFLGLWCIFSPNHLMVLNWLTKFSVTTQELAVFSLVPIALYDGRKLLKSGIVQWVFYLFYPVHLMVLYLIGRL
jgi:hypothetical protein